MRISGQPENECTAAWRNFHSRPPGAVPPVEVSGGFEQARKELKRFDPGLELWWSPQRHWGTEMPGRWRVMQWGERAQNWIHILYWEGEKGEFRPLPPTGPLINRLMAMRQPLKPLTEEVAQNNDRVQRAGREDFRRTLRDHWMNTRSRGKGTQRVYGQGVIRSRKDINAPSIDPEYVRLMRERGIRRYG
jgi:hypothetical protein